MWPILGIAFLASIFVFSLPSISPIASVSSSPVPKSSVNHSSIINGTTLKKIFPKAVKCLTNYDCWTSGLGTDSTCLIDRQECTCNFGFTTRYTNVYCILILCTYNSECKHDFSHSLCDPKISQCVCEPGYAVNKNTAQCETSDSNIDNPLRLSFLLLILGLLAGFLPLILYCSFCVFLFSRIRKQMQPRGGILNAYLLYFYNICPCRDLSQPNIITNDECPNVNTENVTSLTFSHLWILSDFTNLYKEDCQWKWQLESEYFSPPDMPLQLSLVLWPQRKCRENDEETALGFEMCSWTVPSCLEGKLTLSEKRWIVDQEGRPLFGREYVEWVLYANTRSGDSDFLPMKQLLDPKNEYLHNGKLTILSEITLHSSTAIFPKEPPTNNSTLTCTTVPLSVTCFSHRFTLEHFKWMSEKRTLPLCIESADFADNQGGVLDEGAVGNLRIAVWPNGDDGLGDDTVGVGLRNRNQNSVLVHLKLRIFNIEEKEDRGEREVQVFYKVERTVRINAQAGRAYPISRRTLFELTDEQTRDQLMVECQVQVLVSQFYCTALTRYTFPCHVTLVLFTQFFLSRDQYASTPTSQSDPPSLRMPTTTISSINLGLYNFHAVNFTWPIEKITSIYSIVLGHSNFHPVTFNGSVEQCTNIPSSATTESWPYLDSRLFFPPTDPRYRFQLRVYPLVGKDVERETETDQGFGEKAKNDQVMLKLRYVSQENETESTTVQWMASLQDASKSEWTRIEQTQLIYKNVDFGLQQLISLQQLNNFSRFLLPDKTLTLQIQLWIHEKRPQLPSELLNQPSASSPSTSGLQIVQSQLQSVVIVHNGTNQADTIILGNDNSTVSQAETPL